MAEHAIGFTPDGKLVTYQQKDDSDETTVNVWDTTDEAAPTPTGVSVALDIAGPDAVALSADGRLVAMADAGSGDIVLVDLIAKARVGEPLKGHTAAVATLLFTKDGKTLVSADADNIVRVWSTATGRQLTNPAKDAGTFIALSEDEKLLAAAREDGTIKLLDFVPVARGDLGDLDEHRMWSKLRPYRPGVNSIIFGPGKETLITANADGTLTLESQGQARPCGRTRRQVPSAGNRRRLRFQLRRRTLAVNESGTAITLLDAETKEAVKTVPSRPRPPVFRRGEDDGLRPKGRKLAAAYST